MAVFKTILMKDITMANLIVMKAIVVPSNSQQQIMHTLSSVSSPMKYTVVDTNGTCVYPPLYAQNMAYISPPPSPVPGRDPLIDYYALYSHTDTQNVNLYSTYFPNTVFLHSSDLASKMWELRKLIDWINDECEDVVLVQRSIDGSSWLAVFISNRDYRIFMDWYRSQTIIRFTLKLATTEREKEYEEWMQHNIHGSSRISFSTVRDGQKEVYVSLADKNEELLFKLRWVGVPDEDEDA